MLHQPLPPPADKQLQGQGTPRSQDCASRPPARQVLIEHIIYLQEQIKNLQILHDMLPTNPTSAQDEACFQMFTRLRNFTKW